jgi:hypothetical protein
MLGLEWREQSVWGANSITWDVPGVRVNTHLTGNEIDVNVFDAPTKDLRLADYRATSTASGDDPQQLLRYAHQPNQSLAASGYGYYNGILLG